MLWCRVWDYSHGQGEWFCLCVSSSMHLCDGFHYKAPLTKRTVLQSPLTLQDDSVVLGHCSAGDSIET